MGGPSWAERWVSRVMAAALGLTGLQVAPSAGAECRGEPEAAAVDFDELMQRAEQQRSAGDHSEAARSYVAAYRALSDVDKPALLGELAIDNSLEAYHEASEQSVDLAQLEELEAQLDEFMRLRTRAHDEGTAEAVPERLEQELEQLRETLDQRRADIEEAGKRDELQPPLEPRPRIEAGIEIFSGGVLTLAGGVALIGGGAWNFVVVDRRVATRLGALEDGTYSPQRQDEFRTELSRWRDEWRTKATAMVITGSLLTAAGIGLTTWGAIRWRVSLRTLKQRRTVGWRPLLVPGGAGVHLSLRL